MTCNIPFKIVGNTQQLDEIIYGSFNDILNSKNSMKKKFKFSNKFAKTGCGMCKIRELIEIGINYFKIVGRGKKLNELIQDVKKVKKAIILTEKYNNNLLYEKGIKKKFFYNNCPVENCYYKN
ncbi:MAG: U32 family peptidase [Clostridiales bacterium]